ncbi:hypothetical protein Tco_0251087 [Tanacetum coccineum]
MPTPSPHHLSQLSPPSSRELLLWYMAPPHIHYHHGAITITTHSSWVSDHKSKHSEDGDDDDGDSSGDDANDEDEEDEEEEDEHLALADSAVIVPIVELVSPPEGTKPVIPPPSTDITTTGARITIRL